MKITELASPRLDLPRTTILALDLGTTTGWALRAPAMPITHGVISFKTQRFEGGGMRYLRFGRWLAEMKAVVVAPEGIGAVYFEEEGTTFRTEHFRTVDSLGLLLRHGAITVPMHDAGQDFARNFVFAQLTRVGAPVLDRIPGGHWQDSMTERCAWALKRLGQAFDALGLLAVHYGYGH